MLALYSSYLASCLHIASQADERNLISAYMQASIPNMATEANKDAAVQSLDIAKSALAAGHLDKAQKFADKAMKLYPSDEVNLQDKSFSMTHKQQDMLGSCCRKLIANTCKLHSNKLPVFFKEFLSTRLYLACCVFEA